MKLDNISIVNATSEQVLDETLANISCKTITFWLDGHYSGGETFQGNVDSPINYELVTIQKYLEKFLKVTIMIDDVRCFDPTIQEFRDYPSRNFLVSWAEKNNLNWEIVHDIFVAYTRP